MASMPVLNQNEIFTTNSNYIISEEVFGNNIAGTFSELVDMFRVDGGLYGDQKVYKATDVLKSHPLWQDTNGVVNKAGVAREAGNLLATDFPDDPEVQTITVNVFRQIRLSIQPYLMKRSFMNEGSYTDFNSIMLGWIRETKRVYDSTTFNSFVGTTSSTKGLQNMTITLSTVADDAEKENRLQAQELAQAVANLIVNLKDCTRDYNDYGYLRSYNIDDLVFVWNSEYVSKLNKLQTPTIFNREGLVDTLGKYTLPARYFGDINTAGGTVPASNTTIRSLIETDYTVSGTVYHVFAGDLLPAQATYEANTTYTVNPNIAFKVFHKRSIPYCSNFEMETEFVNPRANVQTHYLSFSRNTLAYLKNFPCITAKVDTE